MIQLHSHSVYSVLDGLLTPDKLAQIGVQDGAIALTDHGNCAGHLPFYNACNSLGVKPLLGVEAYFMQSGYRYHITVIANNTQGYQDLLKMQSMAAKTKSQYAIIDMSFLSEISNNLTITTGCSSGLPIQIAKNNGYDSLFSIVENFASKFKNLFVEFQPNYGYINEYHMLWDVAQKIGLPYIVTNDVHYAEKGDYKAYANVNLLFTKKEPTLKLDWLYPWSTQELNTYFINNNFPNDFIYYANKTAIDIAENVNVIINKERKWHFEERPSIVWEGAKIKLLELKNNKLIDVNKWDIYIERLSYEFQIFKSLKLLGYLEFCQNILNNCRKNNIPYGPGRGSCVGSLICYLMGITEIDPIEHNLSFERFLSPNYCIGIAESSGVCV